MNRKSAVLLIGGKSRAASLATSLLEQGYRVTVINETYEDCVRFADIKGLGVICGDGTKLHVLEEADAASFDIAIALTGKDADNLVACQLCKKRFGVARTVSIVSDPNKTEFFRKMGVDRVVCAVSALTTILKQQAFLDEMTNIVPIGEGRVQIVEVQITEQSPVVGKKLWEISLPQEAIVGCVLRRDSTVIPRGDTRILAGDTLVVLSGGEQALAAVHVLTGE